MRQKTFFAIFLSLLAIWLFSLCKTTTTNSPSSTYLNLQDTVDYVGMATCRSCHDNVHQTYSQTGMGRSFHLATRQKSDAKFGDHALVYDTLNDLYYFPFFDKNEQMNVLEFRLSANGDTVHQRLEKISYIVGSGQHTNSHIIDEGGYLYQAPVTWYTQDGRWDLAPGFRVKNSRFDRFLTDECITCHNHFPTLLPGSLNKFADMPTGIECERCHGPGEVHAREMLAGRTVDTSQYIDYTIVTPSDLPRDLQMDLCQRCHLQGIAVTQPGKTFFDFKPGMPLSDVMNIYLPRYADSHEKFIMASQADRLRLSKCYQNSEMTCLNCHHPHQSVEATPREKYNSACLGCHVGNENENLNENKNGTCTAATAEREANGDDCSACHMPTSGSIDIPHVKITDHWISIPSNQLSTTKNQESSFLGLQILTKENPTPIDMTRGYLTLYDKYIDSPVMLDSAAFYLDISQADFSEIFPLRIHLLFNRGDWQGILAEAEKMPDVAPLDAWTAYRIGEAYSKSGNAGQALLYLERATELLPLHLDFLEKKGLVLASLQRINEAKQVFEKVLSENPKRPVALCNLGFVHAMTGNFAEGEKLYDQAIALDPDYPQAMLNKAAVLIYQNKKAEAKKWLLRVLELEPENIQAVQAMGLVQGS